MHKNSSKCTRTRMSRHKIEQSIIIIISEKGAPFLLKEKQFRKDSP
jgi:hypothetical protein